MKLRCFILVLACIVPSLAWSSGTVRLTAEDQKKIDEMAQALRQKEALPVEKIPETASQLIQSRYPDFRAQSAQKEYKKGHTYLVINGIDDSEVPIEFHLRYQKDELWEIIEVQRELTIVEVP